MPMLDVRELVNSKDSGIPESGGIQDTKPESFENQ